MPTCLQLSHVGLALGQGLGLAGRWGKQFSMLDLRRPHRNKYFLVSVLSACVLFNPRSHTPELGQDRLPPQIVPGVVGAAALTGLLSSGTPYGFLPSLSLVPLFYEMKVITRTGLSGRCPTSGQRVPGSCVPRMWKDGVLGLWPLLCLPPLCTPHVLTGDEGDEGSLRHSRHLLLGLSTKELKEL